MMNKTLCFMLGLFMGSFGVASIAQGPGVSPGLNYFKGINGSPDQPTYTFLNDTRSGMLLTTPGQVAISANRVRALDVTTTRVGVYLPVIPQTATVDIGVTATPVRSVYVGTMMRLANTATVSARNGAGTADLPMLSMESGNVIAVGGTTATPMRFGTGVVSRPTSGTYYLCISSAGLVTASAFACSGS